MRSFIINLLNNDRVRISLSAITGLGLISIAPSFEDGITTLLLVSAYILPPIVFSFNRSLTFKRKHWYNANGISVNEKIKPSLLLKVFLMYFVGFVTIPLLNSFIGALFEFKSSVFQSAILIFYPSLIVHCYLFLNNLSFNSLKSAFQEYRASIEDVGYTKSSIRIPTYTTDLKHFSSPEYSPRKPDMLTDYAYSNCPGNIHRSFK